MFIYRKQKSAETEIRCTKANHSAHKWLCVYFRFIAQHYQQPDHTLGMTNSFGVKAGVSQKIWG